MTKKSNTRIVETKFPPHRRLKNLRNLLDLTQKQLADACGYSEAQILSVELGQRRMTSELGLKICYATGVGPLWLLGNQGTSSKPLTDIGTGYDPTVFHLRKNAALRGEVEPNEDQVSDIHHLCHELTQLMQAACRRSRFGMAKLYFRQMVDVIKAHLHLKSFINDDKTTALQRYLFSYEPDGTYEGEIERHEREQLWELISPTAAQAWGRALAGSQAERVDLRHKLSLLPELIEESFLSRSPLDAELARK